MWYCNRIYLCSVSVNPSDKKQKKKQTNEIIVKFDVVLYALKR
jgi:hypothetical protein